MTDTDAGAPRIVPTREGYDRWAHIYDDEDNPLIALESRFFPELLGDVRGLRIADLGCGTGRHALAMAAAGARVVAVDFSAGMLSKARAKGEDAGVQFLRHDLANGLPFVSAAFDRITCCLVLEHIDDLPRMMSEMARICRAGGRIVISELHPAMRLLDVQAQFTDPATGCKTRPAGAAHRISDYVVAAASAGLRVERTSEHSVDEALVARSPRAAKYLGRPLLLLLGLRKPGGAPGSHDLVVSPPPVAPAAVERIPLAENLDFAVALLQHAPLSPRGNAVLCPHGWSESLGLLAEGAGGKTREELEGALQRAPAESAAFYPAADWASRTRAWVHESLSIRPAFERTAAARLARGLDPDEMKSWANDGLETPIASLINWSFTDLTAIVIVNVSRFAGTWRTPFPVEGTRDAPFRRAAGDSVLAPLMSASLACMYLESEEWQVVRLPYANPDLDAVVLLPRIDELPVDVLARTGARPIREILGEGHERTVEVALPRFEFLNAYHGRPMLAAMGIREAWALPGADFSGISEEPLYLAKAQQAVSLRVDEAGTKAEAITRLQFAFCVRVDEPPVLRADHPFVFLVVHRPSRAILFAAVVGDPTESTLPGVADPRPAGG